MAVTADLATNSDSPRVPSCPMCGEKITMFAMWESDVVGVPDAPKFWGDKDKDARAILHSEGAWVHFRVNGDRGRLAYLALRARKPRKT